MDPADPPGPLRGNPTASAEGAGNIAIGGHASGTFVAGTGNRVTVVAGLGLAVLLALLAVVGFGLYDHWRDISEQRTLAEAVAAAKAEAAREVEHLRGESGLKDQLIAAKDAAIDALAGRAGAPGTSAETVTAALDALAAGDSSRAESIFRRVLETKAAEGAAANREAAEAARNLGALAYGRDTAAALAAYRQAAELDPSDAWTWIFVSRLERQAGRLAAAEEAARRARDAATAAGDERTVMVADNDLGDVRVQQGNLPEAKRAYQAAMTVAKELAASEPGNAEWQRDPSVSWNKLGDVRRAQGDLPGALAAFGAGLAIRERLAASDPGNAEWQRDPSVSWNRLGGLRLRQGDLAGALDAFGRDLEIAERLAALDAGNAGWQLDVAISHSMMGQLRAAGGESEAAAGHYRKGLEIARALAAAGRLAPRDAGIVGELEEGLAEAGGGSGSP